MSLDDLTEEETDVLTLPADAEAEAAERRTEAEHVLEKGNLGGLPITDVQASAPYLTMLVYGQSGVGKTVLAASAADVPDMSPVLILDCEGGTRSIAKFGYNVDVVRVTQFNQFVGIYTELARNKTPYRTVVLDSLSEMQRKSMGAIMQAVLKDDPERDPEVPSIREWGKNGEQIRRFVRAFRDLPMHTIFTALTREGQDRFEKPTYQPGMAGQMSREVQAYVDLSCYMYLRQTREGLQRLLLTSPLENTMAKDRTGMLPIVVADPTMGLIMDYVEGRIQADGEGPSSAQSTEQGDKQDG